MRAWQKDWTEINLICLLIIMPIIFVKTLSSNHSCSILVMSLRYWFKTTNFLQLISGKVKPINFLILKNIVSFSTSLSKLKWKKNSFKTLTHGIKSSMKLTKSTSVTSLTLSGSNSGKPTVLPNMVWESTVVSRTQTIQWRLWNHLRQKRPWRL